MKRNRESVCPDFKSDIFDRDMGSATKQPSNNEFEALSDEYLHRSLLIPNILSNFVPKSLCGIIQKYEDTFIRVQVVSSSATSHSKTLKYVSIEWKVQNVISSFSLNINGIRMVAQGRQLDPAEILRDCEIRDGSTIYFFPRLAGDIGYFIDEYLNYDTKRVIQNLRKKQPSSYFEHGSNILTREECTKLCCFRNETQPENYQYDWQMELSRKELADVLSHETIRKICLKFGNSIFDCIKIRHVNILNKVIPFHLDVSKRTMQISLNDNYIGGKLIYLTDDGQMHIPERIVGSFTLHDNNIVHGVSSIQSGHRISLFFFVK